MSASLKVLRCAIYIRVSTAMQRMEGWSLDAQRASLTAYASSRGWKVVAIYADEGKSARKRLKDRKEIHRLLDDVRTGDIDIILFKELDRWFRNVSDFYKVQDVLDAHGVTWVSERQPTLDMTSKEGRLNVNVLLSVGQNEADSTSDRIKYTNKFMRQQKRWTSSKRTLPRGYTLDANQHVIIDSEWESYVRAAIDRIMRYGSIRKALLETNDEFGRNVLYNNFVNMIRNPLLYGHYKDVENFVEKPYLTKTEFDALQNRTRRNARDTPNRMYIFSNRVHCHACHYKMTGATQVANGKQYKYYRCRKAKVERQCSNNLLINEAKMEKALMQFIKETLNDRIANIKSVRQERARKPRKSNRESIERQLDKLEDLYIASERMTKERYEEKRAAILSKLITEDEEEKLPDVVGLEKIQALFDGDIVELYETFSLEERREFWFGIVNEIHVENGQIVDVDFIA